MDQPRTPVVLGTATGSAHARNTLVKRELADCRARSVAPVFEGTAAQLLPMRFLSAHQPPAPGYIWPVPGSAPVVAALTYNAQCEGHRELHVRVDRNITELYLPVLTGACDGPIRPALQGESHRIGLNAKAYSTMRSCEDCLDAKAAIQPRETSKQGVKSPHQDSLAT